MRRHGATATAVDWIRPHVSIAVVPVAEYHSVSISLKRWLNRPTLGTASKDEQPEFRKIQEVADLFRISRSTAFRMMKEQGWPRHKFGTEIRFSAEDVAAIRAMNREVPPVPKVAPTVGTRANRRKRQTGEQA